MSSSTKGFVVRDVTVPHGWQPFGQANYNVGKVLPATATGNLFSIFKLPRVLGTALPAPVAAQGSATSCASFVCSNTTLTVTTDATNTMAITWILLWAPASLGQPVSGITVTNS